MFINTLPIIFQYTDAINPLEFLLFSSILFLVLYFSATDAVPETAPTRIIKTDFYQYLKQGWLGFMSLPAVFWPFFLIFNLAIFSADYLVKSGTFSISSWGNVHLMLAGPLIWWLVAVWRSQALSRVRLWNAASRFIVSAALVEFLLRIFLRIELPRIFFSCDDLMINYYSCF